MMTMDSAKLVFTPFDVWLFRDSRPFNAEDDHSATGMFPPMPTVMQGALRTAWLVANNVDFHDYKVNVNCPARPYIGDPGSETLPDGQYIKGPFLAKYEDDGYSLCFPAPANLDAHGRRLLPCTPPGFLGSSLVERLRPIGVGEQDQRCWAKRYCGVAEMERYLAGGDVDATHLTPEEEVVTPDRRVGIMLQQERDGVKCKTVREGYLWSVAFSALSDNYGLAVETNLNGFDYSRYKLTRLGGENKAAQVSVANWTYPVKPHIMGRKFLLYLATPALFQHDDGTTSWRPQSWSALGLPAHAKLVGYLPASGSVIFRGWDIAAGAPRPNRWGVPAGSVYFFECDSDLNEHDQQLLANRHIIPLPGLFANAGAGITFVGGW